MCFFSLDHSISTPHGRMEREPLFSCILQQASIKDSDASSSSLHHFHRPSVHSFVCLLSLLLSLSAYLRLQTRKRGRRGERIEGSLNLLPLLLPFSLVRTTLIWGLPLTSLFHVSEPFGRMEERTLCVSKERRRRVTTCPKKEERQ